MGCGLWVCACAVSVRVFIVWKSADANSEEVENGWTVLTLVLLSESGFCIYGRCDHDQESVILNDCESDVLFRLKRVGRLDTGLASILCPPLCQVPTCIINFTHILRYINEIKRKKKGKKKKKGWGVGSK